MQITGIDHYNIRVPMALLEPLSQFYVQTLNLRVGLRPPFRSVGYWLYAGDQPLLHLTGFETEADAGARPTGWFDHVAFKCDDLAMTVRRLKTLGIEYQLAEVPELGQTQVFFTDIAGIGVELNFNAGLTPDEG